MREGTNYNFFEETMTMNEKNVSRRIFLSSAAVGAAVPPRFSRRVSLPTN